MISQTVKHSPSVLTLDIKDVDLSIVNAIRRVILAEVPTIACAFDPLSDKNPDITITTNNSALHNEYLAHRISLIPMCFPEEVVDDEAFDPEDYIFTLKVKNTSQDIIPVTSKDIRISNREGRPYPEAFHSQIFPANPITKDHILITKLRPNIYNAEKGEEIDITFKGSRNIAKAHSRWSPVSCCALANRVDEKEADAALKKALKSAEDTKGSSLTTKEADSIRSRFDTLDRYRHFVKNQYGEACEFHFKIESECGLSPRYIFSKAISVLVGKLNIFVENLRSQKGVSINRLHESQHFYEMVIEDEDYTLLNVLQCGIYNREIREKHTSTPLEYIGYYQPHPLDNKMILKLKFKKAVDVTAFVAEHASSIAKEVEALGKEWAV